MANSVPMDPNPTDVFHHEEHEGHEEKTKVECFSLFVFLVSFVVRYSFWVSRVPMTNIASGALRAEKC